MPQLMPLFWKSSILIIVMLIMMLMIFYFMKSYEFLMLELLWQKQLKLKFLW